MDFPKRFRTRRLLLTPIEPRGRDDLARMRRGARIGHALGGMRPASRLPTAELV